MYYLVINKTNINLVSLNWFVHNEFRVFLLNKYVLFSILMDQ